MNAIDKVIEINFKMPDSDIGINISTIVAVGIGGVLAYFSSFAGGLFIIIPVIFWGYQRTCEKIFHTSVFGSTALLYNSFPVNTKDLVIGKVLAASFILDFYLGGFLALYTLDLAVQDDFWADFNITYSFIAVKSLELIGLVILNISQSAYIFMIVVIYSTGKYQKSSAIKKLFYILVCGLILVLLYYFPAILYFTKIITNEVILTLLSIVLSSLLIIPFGRKTINLLDSMYAHR